MSNEYEFVSKGALKLKGDGTVVNQKKRKKKRNDEIKKYMENVKKLTVDTDSAQSCGDTAKVSKHEGPQLTKAQLSFIKMQEKRQTERVMEKAMKSHKQRVEEFNSHLDSLTEHYDIPKVSWTK